MPSILTRLRRLQDATRPVLTRTGAEVFRLWTRLVPALDRIATATAPVIAPLRARWSRLTADPKQAEKRLLLALGVVGWIILVVNYPFGWELPKYANF